MKKAILLLEDGSEFLGESFGAQGEKLGEVIFNTSMTGYQEILTDPSYRGQMVVMTYPLIGNYGVNPKDVQSEKIYCEAFIVGRNSRIYSNYRAKSSLSDYLIKNNIIGISNIDTRLLTRQLRLRGAMRGIVSTKNFNTKTLMNKLSKWKGITGVDLVKDITIAKPKVFSNKGKFTVVVVDCGVKRAILEELSMRNCKVVVVPALYSSEEILKFNPHAVLVSNGPGDPSVIHYLIHTIKSLLGKLPVFGICLGHQLIGLALGGKTYKLKFGHHGANHPVKDIQTGRVLITAQNHNYCVNSSTLPADSVQLTHVNLYDNTEAGLKHKFLPVYSVQFHPEASPGPREARIIFDRFISITEEFYASR
ncbi:MAG: glutamine-hydrolyzing carbamoyl-phosphate synthase small subunit [bacterium]